MRVLGSGGAPLAAIIWATLDPPERIRRLRARAHRSRFSPRCDLPEHRGLPPLRARSSGDGLDRNSQVSRGRVEGDFPIGHKRASRAPAAPHQLFPPPSRPAFFSILDSGSWSARPPKGFRAVLTCPALGKVCHSAQGGISRLRRAKKKKKTARPVSSKYAQISLSSGCPPRFGRRAGGWVRVRTGTGPAHGASPVLACGRLPCLDLWHLRAWR